MSDKPEIESYDVEVDGVRFTRVHARTIGKGKGMVIGCVDLMMESDRSACFRLLHVHPAFRRIGVGRALIEECSRLAREAGRVSLGLEISDRNSEAHLFYRALGFIEAYRFNCGQAVLVKLLDFNLAASS